MADPFSIVAGTVGLTDVCFRVGVELRRLIRDTGSVGKELDSFAKEVSELEALCRTIRTTFEGKSEDGLPEYSRVEQPLDLQKHLEQALSNCHGVLNKVDEMIRRIRGAPTTETPLGKVDSVKAILRKRLRESDVHNWRVQLTTYQRALQLVLTAITFQEAKTSNGSTSRSIDDLSTDVRNLDQSLQLQLADLKTSALSSGGSNYDMAAFVALKDLREAVNTASTTVQSLFSNRHFDIPQSVSSIFTGREDQLEELAQIFIPERRIVRDRFQRRFIVHGLGGSGKTQFCCKFAEANRDSFWGIFWIDASTPERIKQTLNDICEVAGIEKNENAAMHWLSNLEHRWLLIIDNADELEVPLETYFPKGDRGNVLVTTRDPTYKVQGNVGPGFYEFRGLELGEATLLLRKASGEANWDAACEAVASAITKTLGFLALAIIHAGAAIRDRLCRLGDYLDYYSRSWHKLRKAESARRVKSTDLETAVYATWEICYGRLEQRKTEAALDAMELLSTLAFFHWDNIGPQVFTRALKNPQKEAEQERKAKDEPQPPDSQSNTWASHIRAIPVAVLRLVLGTTNPPALPRFLRDSLQRGCAVDGEDRLREALKELTRMSLVIHNEYSDTYWIHPIVHKWARERMRPADQALWADVAGRVLSASILLPPLGATTEDESYHLGLLSHVRHIQASRTSAAARLVKARAAQGPSSAWVSRLVPALGPDAEELRMCGKFGLVYYKSGEWQSAAELLIRVRDALCQYLGPEHKRARAVTLYLSAVYWNMGRPEKAAELQSDLLEACESSLGPDHPDTLKVMSELGRTRWQQGQYSAAARLQETVLEKLTRILPRDSEEVLEATDDLGLTVQKFWERADFERAYRLHSAAADGLSKIHGPDHPRTLVAKENACRVAAMLGGPHLARGRETMAEVFETRRAKLGREHPYTLLAMVNMAILLSATGSPEKAEALILEGLPVADRSLGKEHVGTLFGRHMLACVWAQQGRYAEAEELFEKVAEGQRVLRSLRGDYHPDRLGALIELAKCCFMQGKLERAISVCDEAICGFDLISERPHPLAVGLREARAGMVGMREDGVEREVAFPYILFRVSDD